MLELTVEYDYLTVDTREWLDDVSADDMPEETEALEAWLTERDATYAHSDLIVEWVRETYGSATGIYGDGDPMDIATCNHDSFLDRDVSFVYVETPDHALMIVNGWSYYSGTPSEVEVRRLHEHDTEAAFSFDSGYAGHAHDSSCQAEWLIEHACKLVANGGMGHHDIADFTDGGKLYCPDCGGELYVSTR